MSTRSLLHTRRARILGVLAVAPLLGLAGPLPAQAAPVAQAAPATQAAPAAVARPVVPAPAYRAAAEQTPAGATAGIETARTSRPVAPGVTLTSFDRYDTGGWLRADALTADLSGGVRVDYLNSGEVTRTEPLRSAATRTRAVAAVNGDFFDINNSGAAQGIGIQSGQLVQSAVSGHNNAVGITAGGIGEIVQVYFDGSATLPSGSAVPLSQFNNMVQPGGIGLFTPLWGSYPRTRAVNGATRVTEVTLTGGRVAQVGSAAGSGPIPAGSTVLLGREGGADALAGLTVGDPVTVAYQPKASDSSRLTAAVGGRTVLVRDGVPQDIGDTTAEPRTALGFSADGRRMFIATVDGRQVDSHGLTLTEMGRMMADLGAHQALELDGGGSSTLLAREPGADAVQVENSPSDGSERPVPNGLAIYAPAGSGRLKGFWVETAIDPAAGPGAAPVPGSRPDRVFPGLTRRLTAAGYDETYGPANGDPRWQVQQGWAAEGRVDGRGVFRAGVSGTVTVTAHRGGATGQLTLSVLGPLSRLASTSERLALRDQAATASFGLVGYDAEGSTAPIEPADVRLEYDRSLFKISPAANGLFTISGNEPSAAGVITVHVGQVSTAIPVSVGLDDQVVADFDDAASWTFSQARATGSVAPVAGHTGTGLKLSYDYTLDTATRAAYANPPSSVDIPGQPLAFTMWVNSAGKGEWPSLHLVDGRGQDLVLRGPYLTWTGWRQIEFTVPPGTVYPLRLRRFYTAETRADARYTSEIVIDELVAEVPPPVAEPAAPAVVDPLVVGAKEVGRAPWRFAVLSDAQFVGREPDSEIVRNARRALREIRAARPDFLIIDGDFVDEGRPEDLALAKRILDEELGGQLPYFYVPGNHEIMGGSIANFTAAFGAAYQAFDHRGTRFITLDTSKLTIRGGGFDQMAMLRAALDSAATDRGIGSVVVVEHVPPRDPTPARASELGDRKEAALLEQWLARFQQTTGKGALFVGAHVGLFHASRVDGVPYFINGNSGKTPSAAPADGGFWGWTMFGVDPVTAQEADRARRDPVAGPRWIAAETRVRVDALALDAPATVPLGAPATVSATVTQGGRQVPVRSPVSADWSASPGVHIGAYADLRPWHVAWFDPRTGRLTALRSHGFVVLAVTVNGVTERATVTLTAAGHAAAPAA